MPANQSDSSPLRNQQRSASASKSPIPSSTPTQPVRRRPTVNGNNKTNSLQNVSENLVQELERERSKVESLNSIISAAEEREIDTKKELMNWKSKVDQLTMSLERMEIELVQNQEVKIELEKVKKDLEKFRNLSKDRERQKLHLAEEFEASKASWVQDEANLRSRLLSATTQLASLQKSINSDPNHETPDDQFIQPQDQSENSLSTALTQSDQSLQQNIQLTRELETIKKEKLTLESDLERAISELETFKSQLIDIERVNQQLMDDNESYQILVGERTLMGGFDLKQLLAGNRSEPFDQFHNSPHSISSASTAPSLAGVEEEEEASLDEDADDVIERAVLESHGNGSRASGAVEAGVSQSFRRKQKRPIKDSVGTGLDLAAELAQAEEIEIGKNQRKKELEDSNLKKNNKKRDQEIKNLQDANKALVLYISKILDRISAHEGFETILANDYAKNGGHPSTIKLPAPETSNPSGTTTNKIGGFLASMTRSSNPSDLRPFNLHGNSTTGASANTATATAHSTGTSGANPKRTSWFQYFTNKSPSPNAASGIKPLRLGLSSSATSGGGSAQTSAGLSGGGSSVKEAIGSEEDDEESRARERQLAGMKLHGLIKPERMNGEFQGKDQNTIRASRRSSSMYGVSPLVTGRSSQEKRISADLMGGGLQNPLQQAFPVSNELVGSPPCMTPAGLIKRGEEREKESKMNLEKGQASGFTEIEIRGHRMRPSAARQLSTATTSNNVNLSGPLSPTASQNRNGMKDLKITNPESNPDKQQSNTNEGLLARTARRISMMGSSRP
ncbi:hypothetical protein O181_050513 [Austropuccinia psidii MF-1]|uniref:Uncharacterized protein n=1 Tax=Austropuccinia psidii MF-1 TaxID=1389203 RepID=A0A9Q3DZA5_9BASI|nr:hypothetical protein [Austropuccinia psidii MF-1]